MTASGPRGACALCFLLLAAPAAALELDARAKLFGTAAALPEHDVQRIQAGTPAYDYSGDLRLMLTGQTGPFTFIVHDDTIVNGGDSFGFLLSPGATLDQGAIDDERRLFDLTWEIESGDGHRTVTRLDRIAVRYESAGFNVTAGRQAVSWGNGLVFQPMDLFSPFAPTTVDRDYKAGDDLLLVEKLFGNGDDLQLLAIGRRDDEGDVSADAASVALKWHGFVGPGELELVAGKHYEDQVYGVSGRRPLGGALVRSDVIATRLDGGDWKVSGIVNVDYSLTLWRRNTYVFAEYYHNGFGVGALPPSVLALPPALLERLGRGEVFNLMKDYVALGTTVEWHPLWNQALTLITNLHDSSSLVQTQLVYEPGDHSRLVLGFVAPLGRAGDEFGGVPVATEAVTTGGALQGYLRWVYYF